MLLKLQIIFLSLAGIHSLEMAEWSRHVVLVFYTDEMPLKKSQPFFTFLDFFHETIPNCFGTLLTNNHVLTGATCVTNYKKYDEVGTKSWIVVKVFFSGPLKSTDFHCKIM
jgi:hypothetical protein